MPPFGQAPLHPVHSCYLFHPTICAWLDAMVQSSTQLHGVVGKCFDKRVWVGQGGEGEFGCVLLGAALSLALDG